MIQNQPQSETEKVGIDCLKVFWNHQSVVGTAAYVSMVPASLPCQLLFIYSYYVSMSPLASPSPDVYDHYRSDAASDVM